MTRRRSISLLLAVSSLFNVAALAQQPASVAVNSVAKYQLGLSSAKQVQQAYLPPVIASYQASPGQPLSITNPFAGAAISYQAADGAKVTQGSPLALLQGPSVEHFFHRLERIKEQYAVAQKQYQNKQSLYQANAISANEWQDFLDNYIAITDSMHEVTIILERFQPTGERTVILSAPNNGIWHYSSNASEVGTLVAQAQLLVAADIPLAMADTVTGLNIGDTQLTISKRAQSTRNGFVRVWANTDASNSWRVGQTLTATPVINIDNGYQIPASAVTSLNDSSIVFMRDDEQLVAIAVEIISAVDNDYMVAAKRPLTGTIVTRSIAAVKAIVEQGE
jgi:hypothetical protein